MYNNVIIVAGGSGQRMGTEIPKQFLLLKGKPVLMHTINSFYKFDNLINIVIVLPVDQVSYWEDLCNKYSFLIPHSVIKGGETRFHSVKNGLSAISEGIVAIHDGVRPLVSKTTIIDAFKLAEENGNAIPVIGITESLRIINNETSEITDREKIKIIQTPQVFLSDNIKDAYQQEYNIRFTDDATVLEATGERIFLSQGNRENIKITSPTDLIIAEALLKLFED